MKNNPLDFTSMSLSPEREELLTYLLEDEGIAFTQARVLTRRAHDDVSPLSFTQQRIWFLHELDPDNPFYNIPSATLLQGHLDIAALERSLNEITRRHEILRTTFTTSKGQPVQVVGPTRYRHLPVIDLQTIPATTRATEAERLALQEALQAFDFARGPLVRATLLRMEREEHVLLLTAHHIVCDGWSIGLFVRELTRLYQAYTHGTVSPLPELSIQYADFAAWQRDWLQGREMEQQLAYWKQQLGTHLPVLEIFTDHPRPTLPTYRGAAQSLILPASAIKALEQLAQQEDCTLFMILLAAFGVLLFRYTSQEDMVIGAPIANRDLLDTENLIGCFINNLVLRLDIAGNPRFRELVRKVKAVCLGAYAHQDLPFEILVKELQPERDLSRSPLFQVMFHYMNVPTQAALQLPGLTLRTLEFERRTVKYDLSLHLVNTDQGLRAILAYSSELFEAATMQRMLKHFQTLVEDVAANPDLTLATISMLTADERHQLLEAWNATRVDDRALGQCIHELFEAQAQRTPHALAIIAEGAILTYKDLDEQANQLAHLLREYGVGPEKNVGLFMERSPEQMVALLAILKAGAAYLPLDPLYPPERTSFLLHDAETTLVLTQSHLLDNLPSPCPPTCCLDQQREHLVPYPTERLLSNVQPANLAYIIYTSGSTGKPKGVQVSHQALVCHSWAFAQRYQMHEGDRMLHFVSLSFDVAAEDLFPPWSTGATVVLRPDSLSLTLTDLHQLIEREHLTILNLTTPYWHAWVSELAQVEVLPPPSLRHVIVGGEKALPEQLATWRRIVGERVRWSNAYGPTETTVSPMIYEPGPDGPLVGAQAVPIGRPMPNTRAYVLDRHLQPVPVGVPGELYIGGVRLARGYLHQPTTTATQFIPDPFSQQEGARLYKTGDLVRYLPDGTLDFLGRIDQQIKIRGYRVEPGEIEAVLEKHPSVREAVVIAQENGAKNVRLVAYITALPQQEVHLADLRGFAQQQLPTYMVPSAYVRLDEFPLTPHGKVDRKALPAAEVAGLNRDYTAPTTELEQQLAALWAEVLGIDPIGIDENFFEVGGHSLLATELIYRMRTFFQLDLPLRLLFEVPTIAGMARAIESMRQTGSAAAVVASLAVDLDAEATLEPEIVIRPTVIHSQDVSEPRALFLTGATGFLGTFLLAELLAQTPATLYCLVRCTTSQEGKERLQKLLEDASLWKPEYEARIIALAGDLGRPLLGLSEAAFAQLADSIDGIYHSGALVKTTYPYQALKAVNVSGTHEIVRLAATHKIKPLHYISTLSVFSYKSRPTTWTGPFVVQEEDSIEEHREQMHGGYAQSKWVAEKLVTLARAQGLPVSIYRLSLVSGHSQSGMWKAEDGLSRALKGCIQLGYLPYVTGKLDMVPVDFVSKAIVHLSRQLPLLKKTFHISNPHPIDVEEMIRFLQASGYVFEQLPYYEWREKLINIVVHTPENALYPYLPLFLDEEEQQQHANDQVRHTGDIFFGTKNTFEGLVNASITCPPVDLQLVGRYLAYFMRTGFLERTM